MKKTFLLALITVATVRISAQDKLYHDTFSLHDVELLDGPFKRACELNVKVLLEYDTDRLLAPFLKEAGLEPKGELFPNWEGLDGHVGGHYLSALAIHYAATGNSECKRRMEYMLSEMKRCQEANGNGYVGGVPDSKNLWAEVEHGNVDVIRRSWVPWYNMHKTYAGLRDAWMYGGSEEAKRMFIELCDWGMDVIGELDDRTMERMLSTEFGGMDEVYADAYQMTGEVKYLDAAKRFSHKEILDSMAEKTDNLDNKHANTQVPKAVGYARIAELSGDEKYLTAADFFWDRVANYRSVSIGGNSRREHFPAADDCDSYIEEREGPESCNTNNMLKLTQDLFRISPEARYADFYERALFNHILSTQHPEHGGYVYFTPMRPSHYRVYSAVNSAMWCCVGTGMENHGKYGEFIYSHDGDSLLVNLFIASRLNWKQKGVTITQNTAFPDEEGGRLTINVKKPTRFKLLIRSPKWVKDGGMKVVCNGKDYAVGATRSSYVVVDRKWKDGDEVEISTPMEVTIEELPNEPEYISVLRGPIVLAAKTSDENLDGLVADDGRWGHIASGPLVPIYETPIVIGERNDILAKFKDMKPVVGHPFCYTVKGVFGDGNYGDLILEPFARIHDSRYIIYWLSMTADRYRLYRDELHAQEQARILLDRRTVDAVNTGEQQPEADHKMKEENSTTGNQNDEAWRGVRQSGYFQYRMSTDGLKNLKLMVRYWANEGANRALEISIDDRLLIVETTAASQGEDRFVNVEYAVPAAMIEDKSSVIITFRGKAGSPAARVYQVRLLKEL